MTKRERVLAVGVLGTTSVVGSAMLCYLFVFQPLADLGEQVKNAKEELGKKQNELTVEKSQVEAVLRLNPRLTVWQKLSLPPHDPAAKKKPGVSPEDLKTAHLRHLQREYERYLSELLRQSGFAGDSIVITPRTADRRGGTTGRGKEPVYERLVFGVAGKARLDGVVQMLQDFHRTNLLHQVRGISLTLPQATSRGRPGRPSESTGALDVSMTVEALLVNGGEDRSALTPSALPVRPRVLAEPERRYDDLARRNMFTGVAGAASKLTEDRVEVLKFVRLTTLSHNGRRWEAYFYDQGKGGAEKRVNAVTVTDFTVYDKYDSVALEGSVVHIDEGQLIFKAGGKFYRLRCGEFLYPAVEEPLSDSELKALGLAPRS